MMPAQRRTLAVMVLALFGLPAAEAQVVAQKPDGGRARPASVESPMERVVTVQLSDVPLSRALEVIAEQGRVKLARSSSLMPADRKVTVDVRRGPLREALRQVLAGTDLDVSVVAGDVLAVVRAKAGPAGPLRPSDEIVGRVTDARTKAGIAGAEVLLEHTRWQTTTDSAGRFRLADVDTGEYTLVVRRLGYKKQSQKVTVRGEFGDTILIALEPVAAKLDELVTTATGPQRRRDLGNAITTIQADSVMQHAPVHSLTELLESRVPGLTTQHTSGAPGDPAKLRLRGLNSALRSNDPVVVVDGVRIYAAQSESRSGNLTNSVVGTGLGGALPAPSPLDQIDPNTIEKIEVFKGPSAATMYGADAANGVIVITTKRGKPGPTRWNTSLTHGRESSPGRYPSGYYRWGHDIVTSTPRFCTLIDLTCAPDSLVLFQALNDPRFTPLGRGRTTVASLTASGGTRTLTYSITGSYSDQLGLLTLPQYEVTRFQDSFSRAVPDWMQRPHRYETWAVTSRVGAQLGGTADVTLSTTLTHSKQQRTELEEQLASLKGTYVDAINGRYYRTNKNAPTPILADPTTALLNDYYTRTTASTLTVITGLGANWQPRPWFTGTGQAGLTIVPRGDSRLLPTYLTFADDSGAVARGNGRSLVSTLYVQGTLRKPLGWGFNFETNVGANVNTTSTEDLASSATGLVSGTSGFGGAKHITVTDATSSQSSYGWYIEPRVSGQRLSLSAGLRLDGGSANGARLTGTGAHSGSLFSLKNLLALPKLSGSWVISEEPWFPFTGVFSSLKLRGAYGHAQVQPGPRDRLRLYNDLVELTTLGNTEIRPERSTEVEAGFDADLFDSRLSVEFTGYRKLQVDALLNVELPGSINGGTSVVKNVGNILNRGLELSVAATPVRRSALTWTAQLSVSRNHNELTKLGRGVDRNPGAGLVEGYPVGSRWSRPILGFADQNGDGVVQFDEVRIGDSAVFVGRLYPAYSSTLHTSVVLFGGALSATGGFTYDHGSTQIDETARTDWVLARALVDPRAAPGEQAAVLAYVATNLSSAGGTNYGLIQTVSTFRFNSLSVNYQMPARISRLLGAQRMGLALQGSNLALHSTYRGKDPNVNAWTPGEGIADGGQLPLPRTWQLRVDLAY